jgi:hypothetical protein
MGEDDEGEVADGLTKDALVEGIVKAVSSDPPYGHGRT